MPKISLKHKLLYLCTLVLIAGWILWSVLDYRYLQGNVRLQTVYAVLAALIVIVFIAFSACILYPDISYTSKKINDNNRDKIYYIRRTMFCMMQMIYVVFLGGMSVSLFYEKWRIGFGVVSLIFAGCFVAVLILYGIHIADCLKETAEKPDQAAEDEIDKI